jgi:hypothetical protein
VRRGAGRDGGRAAGVPGMWLLALKLNSDLVVQKKWGCCYENGEFYYIKVYFFFWRWGEITMKKVGFFEIFDGGAGRDGGRVIGVTSMWLSVLKLNSELVVQKKWAGLL